MDAIRELARDRLRERESEPRLPDSSDAGERQKADLRSRNAIAEQREISVAADEARRLARKRRRGPRHRHASAFRSALRAA